MSKTFVIEAHTLSDAKLKYPVMVVSSSNYSEIVGAYPLEDGVNDIYVEKASLNMVYILRDISSIKKKINKLNMNTYEVSVCRNVRLISNVTSYSTSLLNQNTINLSEINNNWCAVYLLDNQETVRAFDTINRYHRVTLDKFEELPLIDLNCTYLKSNNIKSEHHTSYRVSYEYIMDIVHKIKRDLDIAIDDTTTLSPLLLTYLVDNYCENNEEFCYDEDYYYHKTMHESIVNENNYDNVLFPELDIEYFNYGPTLTDDEIPNERVREMLTLRGVNVGLRTD